MEVLGRCYLMSLVETLGDEIQDQNLGFFLVPSNQNTPYYNPKYEI